MAAELKSFSVKESSEHCSRTARQGYSRDVIFSR
jgi:hypothetical protein